MKAFATIFAYFVLCLLICYVGKKNVCRVLRTEIWQMKSSSSSFVGRWRVVAFEILIP